MYKVDYKGDNSGTGPSPNIWADCPIIDMLVDPNVGYRHFDDFLTYDSTATTVKNASGYPVYEGDCAIKGTATTGGELALFGTTDNEEAALQVGGVNGAQFVISDTAGAAKKLWFEARVKKSAITNSLGGFFVGLAEENSGQADFMADAGNDFADVDLIGFWNDESDDSTGSHVHFIYQISGQAFVTKIDTVATLAADTYVKLGFVYDPDAEASKKIKVFVDGVEQTTYVTATDIAGSKFPDGEEMSPIVAIKMASNNDMTVTMDWWACAQLR